MEVFFLDHCVTENTLVVARDGTVLVGLTCASEQEGGGLLRSRDGGKSWQKVVPLAPGDPRMALNAAMGSIALDPASGRLLASSMGDVSVEVAGAWAEKIAKLVRKRESWSDTLAYSDDLGDSWHVVRGQFRDGGDWGKTFVGPAVRDATRARLQQNGFPSVVYHCMGATFSCTSYCWRSLDGGASFQLTKSPVFSEYVGQTPLPYPAVPNADASDDRHTLAGAGVVMSDGWVVIPANINGEARLYLSGDEGDTWTHRVIDVARVRSKKTRGSILGFQEPPNAGKPWKPQQPFHALYGSTAMSALWSQQLARDEHDALYLAWVDAVDDLPYVSVSRDRGATWSEKRRVSAAGVDMASIAAIAVGRPGEVAVAYYASRDGGETFDGCVSATRDLFASETVFRSLETSPGKPIQPNRLSEPIELVGVGIAPDGTVWASFARDTAVFDPQSDARQCDGNFRYNGTRYRSVIARLDPA